MDLNTLYTKGGWIEAVRQIAEQLPEPDAFDSINLIGSPSTATAEEIADKVNAILLALKTVG